MPKKILTVAAPKWQNALSHALPPGDEGLRIVQQTAAAAVAALATNPAQYRALALDPAAAGTWLNTLLELTIGDTANIVPLLLLGDQRLPGHQPASTPALPWPPNPASFKRALSRAASHNAHRIATPVGENFSNFEAIRVRYQPVIRLRDLLPTTVEVLARMINRNGQTMGPGSIVDAMANHENAMAISKFIMQLALQESQRGGFDQLNLKVAFNLPLSTIMDSKILAALEAIRVTCNIPKGAIKLELTETQPVTDTAELATVMTKFTDAGYRLALDDITPDTHNLPSLLQLPFRAVKLDRSVVANAQNQNPEIAGTARDFISHITSQAAISQRAVIAEGIETQPAITLLKSLGVTHGQGYYFARPLPATALQPWLTHWRTEAYG